MSSSTQERAVSLRFAGEHEYLGVAIDEVEDFDIREAERVVVLFGLGDVAKFPENWGRS